MTEKTAYLNLGCGYQFHPHWVNVDFVSTGAGVIGHNLNNGVPFPDNSFDVVYHSNLLEHFQKKDAGFFMSECYRVVKPGGRIRVVVPDLESILKEYKAILSKLEQDPDNDYLKSCYDWILLELYDQTVRETTGGDMLKFLCQENLINEDFVIKRCGNEVEEIINNHRAAAGSSRRKSPSMIKRLLHYPSVKHKLRSIAAKMVLGDEYKYYQEGKFRKSGEIHFWMYDWYSLTALLKGSGFTGIQKLDAFTSDIPVWSSYELDTVNGKARKPDSLFMEAVKR